MRSNQALLFILLTIAIDSIGIGIIFPVMPDLMQSVTGEDLAHAALWGGVLSTAFAVMQFLCGPIVGNLSDRFGRRPVMLIALATMAVDYVVMALAQSVWILLVTRIIAGITAATYATAAAYIADVSPAEQRARNFGFIGAAFGIGFVLGPMIGGLASVLGTRAPFWIAAGIAAANFIYGALVLPESLKPEKRRALSWARANPLASFRAIGHLPGLRRYLFVMFLYTTCFTSYPAIWSYYGKAAFGWDGWWNGISLAVFGLFMGLAQGLGTGPAVKYFGERLTAIYGSILHAITFVFYGFIRSGAVAIAFSPVAAAGDVAGPAMQGTMSNLTPDDQQGELQGVLSAVNSVAASISPLVMTYIFYRFTEPGAAIYAPGAPFLLAAALMVVCVLVLVATPSEKPPAAV